MDLTGIRDAVEAKIKEVLVGVAASAPAHDLDSVAHQITDALDRFEASGTGAGGASAPTVAATETDATGRPDDVQVAATAEQIASGGVVEPPAGGTVIPTAG
jgi:hypothetical protein